jgi:hypothetical protein
MSLACNAARRGLPIMRRSDIDPKNKRMTPIIRLPFRSRNALSYPHFGPVCVRVSLVYTRCHAFTDLPVSEECRRTNTVASGHGWAGICRAGRLPILPDIAPQEAPPVLLPDRSHSTVWRQCGQVI